MRRDCIRPTVEHSLHDTRRPSDRAHLHSAKPNGPRNMRDRDTIDAELRLLAAVRRSIREQGGEPSSRQVDELRDERQHFRLPRLGA
jgi:hypothetical protein